MNIYKFKTILIALSATLTALLSCDHGEKFTIDGTVANADGHTLYLVQVGTTKSDYVDSASLGHDGKFRFSRPRPECYDFYRLQADKKGRMITIAIDSTETVTVTSDIKNFADDCTITGSEESIKIQELTALESALQQQVNSLIKNSSPAIGETRETIRSLIEEFKQNICKQYIAPAPYSASAYYALFLNLNGSPIFNPMENRFDSKCFSAVATSLNLRYPHATRAMHLYNTALKGMSTTRPAKRDTIDIASLNITEKALFDIKLPNIDGDSISLSSLKGKVVLLDFTVYSDTKIATRNIKLRELYDKHRAAGLEIYQISYDGDEHFWKTSADNLPWVCVHDNAPTESDNISLYRVEKLPTFFLINRKNELVLRDAQIEDLEKTITNLLNE